MTHPDDEHTVVARGRRAPVPGDVADDIDDATQLSSRRSPESQGGPQGEPEPEFDDATRLTARRAAEEPVDDATRISTRREPELDDATRLTVRRAPAEPVDEATRLSARRTPPSAPAAPASVFPMGPPPSADGAVEQAGTDAPDLSTGPERATDGATGERTDETILRSVRRTPPSGPEAEPQQSDPATRRAAYIPGDEASDRRPPRSPAAVRADRQPVVSPSSISPAPAPDATASRRRRERRRLLLAAGIAVLVIAAAAVALILLLI